MEDSENRKKFDEKYDFKLEETHIEEMKNLISQIRNIRTNANVHPSKKSELIFIIDDQEYEIRRARIINMYK